MFKTCSVKYDEDSDSMADCTCVETDEFPTDIEWGYDICDECLQESMEHCLDCPVASYYVTKDNVILKGDGGYIT